MECNNDRNLCMCLRMLKRMVHSCKDFQNFFCFLSLWSKIEVFWIVEVLQSAMQSLKIRYLASSVAVNDDKRMIYVFLQHILCSKATSLKCTVKRSSKNMQHSDAGCMQQSSESKHTGFYYSRSVRKILYMTTTGTVWATRETFIVFLRGSFLKKK